MNLLIIEGSQNSITELSFLLRRFQHQIIYAANSKEASNRVTKQDIDVVFVEVILPSREGTESIKQIRAVLGDRWVYIVALTPRYVVQDVEAGLEAGADTYISLPVNPIILNSTLKNLERTIELRNNLLDSNRQLTHFRKEKEVENILAKEVFNRLIRHGFMQDDQVQHWLLPSSTFSGDLIGVRRDSLGNLFFFIADATGHGLAAALPTMVVNQVFRALINKGFSISEIVREINQRLYEEIPVGHFVALAAGKVDFSAKSVEVWNGGFPDLLLISHAGKLLSRFSSRNVFVGVLSDADFKEETEIYFWNEDCELIAYSDGVTDAVNADGKQFGEENLMQLLLSSSAINRVENVRESLLEYMDNRLEQDDVSCLSVRCH